MLLKKHIKEKQTSTLLSLLLKEKVSEGRMRWRRDGDEVKINLLMTFIFLYICPLFNIKHFSILYFLVEDAQKKLRLKLNRTIFNTCIFDGNFFYFSLQPILRNQTFNN